MIKILKRIFGRYSCNPAALMKDYFFMSSICNKELYKVKQRMTKVLINDEKALIDVYGDRDEDVPAFKRHGYIKGELEELLLLRSELRSMYEQLNKTK